MLPSRCASFWYSGESSVAPPAISDSTIAASLRSVLAK